MSKSMKPRIVSGVKLGLVVVSPEWQPRESLSTEHLRDLVEVIRAGAVMPPLDVVELPDGFALVDGYHRHGAYLALAVPTCDVRVITTGDAETARWWSYAANRSHGLKRTNADKRLAVKAALAHSFAGDLNTEAIAEHCGVGVELVREVRNDAQAPAPKTRAHEAATEAVAQESARVERGDKPRTAGQIAKAAGVDRETVRREMKRSGPRNHSGKVPHSEESQNAQNAPEVPDTSAWDAVDALIAASARQSDWWRAIAALRHGDEQRLRGDLEVVRAGLVACRPTPCPRDEHGATCCYGRGWVTRREADTMRGRS